MGRLSKSSLAQTVTVDPTRPERVYAAGPAGVFKSDDAGETWQNASGGLQDTNVVSLSLDPQKQDRVFAATEDGRVFESSDGANSWHPMTS